MSCDIEEDLIEKLQSSDNNDIYDALLKIKEDYLEKDNKIIKLEKFIQYIVSFMEHPKFCKLSLYIIAEGCLELSFVNEIIRYNGIESLVRIMKSNVNDEIQNKACYALGNLVKFETGYNAVHMMNPISNIINFLSETNDVNCQQTALCTLMNLSKYSKSRELIYRKDGLIYIAKFLLSANVQVLSCSAKALAMLTHNCSITCAQQLLELHFHTVLIELNSHSEKSIRKNALISLKNLSFIEEIRAGLVKAGAVNLFTEILLSCESHEMIQFAALALCKYLDHLHMWCHNGTDKSTGLKALLTVLKKKQFQSIHTCVITALIPLSFEFHISEILLNLDVLQILIELLGNFIINNKCISVNATSILSNKDLISSDCKLIKENELEHLNVQSYQKCENYLYRSIKNSDNSENSISPEKSHDSYLYKTMHKWDSPIYNRNCATSDYSGSCSPNGMCSPVQYAESPEFNYNIVESPSTGRNSSGVWSPVSLVEDNLSYCANNWSPVISTQSYSPVQEDRVTEYEKNEDILSNEFFLTENVNSAFLQSYSIGEEKTIVSKHEYICDKPELLPSKKKLKTVPHFHSELPSVSENNINYSYEQFKESKCKSTQNCSKDVTINVNPKKNINEDSKTFSPELKNNPLSTKSVLNDNEPHSDMKCSNEICEQQSVDYCAIVFILHLSFHIDKKTNSPLADKTFFAVIMDYLCLIHKPNLKAEILLLNLIKNRYCLEKIILNGFFCELEEKMNLENVSCVQHYNFPLVYANLITVAKQEVESDYGIGTLLHVLTTAGKKGQLHGICTVSKLVTEKSSLHKLLLEANGLSLLLDFLSDFDVGIKTKAMTTLCELYKSLTKQQKSEKCCFEGVCAMKTTTKCFYKDSFLDITFAVSGGVKILANRDKICENSDYFRALLQGYFIESNSGLINLPHISAENLSTIFHFLHGCGNGNCCPYITRIPFSVLLELLSDCEKFLLVNIKSFVQDRLCHQLLPSLIPKIYEKSKKHNSPALAKKALCSALNIDSSHKDLIWSCFTEILNLNSSIYINSDIKDLFKNLLSY